MAVSGVRSAMQSLALEEQMTVLTRLWLTVSLSGFGSTREEKICQSIFGLLFGEGMIEYLG